MQLTGNGYQLDCNIPDSTIGYFKSKKKYHHYDEDTKEYYDNEKTIPRYKEKNEPGVYIPCDGRTIKVEDNIELYNQFVKYDDLPTRIAKVNEELQNYCEREVNYTAFNQYKLNQIFDTITSICTKYQVPRNIVLQYYKIAATQLMNNIPSVDAHETINDVYNKYANKVRE